MQDLEKSFRKTISLNVTQFYNFYNCLTASTQIFYNDKLKDKYSLRKSFLENENDICPICDEHKVSIMLECYHFFCEKCINVWLFDKKNSCPLCRYEINLNNHTHNITNSQHWDILEKVDQNEFDKDAENRFEKVMNTLFK